MFARWAKTLRDRRWRSIIPLVAGEKRPAIWGWERFNRDPPNDARVEAWSTRYPNAGIGLAYGPDGVVGVDLDWTDPPTADAAWRITLDCLGSTPLVRVGLPPKRLALYRAQPGMSPVGKAFGGFEIYTRSAQTVLFGIHPATGRRYDWPDRSPLEVSPDDLPVVGGTQLQALVDALAPCRAKTRRSNAPPAPNGARGRPLTGSDPGIAAKVLKALRVVHEPVLEAAAILYAAPHGERHHTAVALVVALMELGRSDRDIRAALMPIYLRLTAAEDRERAERVFMNALAWARERIGPDNETLLADPVMTRSRTGGLREDMRGEPPLFRSRRRARQRIRRRKESRRRSQRPERRDQLSGRVPSSRTGRKGSGLLMTAGPNKRLRRRLDTVLSNIVVAVKQQDGIDVHSDWIEEMRGVAPSKQRKLRIGLAVHFSRADLASFADFKGLRTSFDGIRGTFASVKRPTVRDLRMPNGARVPVSITLYDTRLLSPAGSGSLKALGDLLGRPKLTLPDVLDECGQTGRGIERMDLVLSQHPDAFKAYALRDPEITADYLALVAEFADSWGLGTLPPTTASMAIKWMWMNVGKSLRPSSVAK
jgi:hypothetical protein